jgi:hypothetical protein
MKATLASAAAASVLLSACAADAPPAAQPPVVAADQCGAGALMSLIGRPRSEIPVPVDPSKRRVVCAGGLVTEDYVPDRVTIRFDAETGIVKSVKCG